AVVRLPDPKLKTLGKRGIGCIFVGYAKHSKAFRFYVIAPNDSVLINSIIESRDAIFDENRLSSVPRPSLRIPNRTEDIGGSVVSEQVTEEVVQQPKLDLRKGKRNRTPKNLGLEFQLYLIEETMYEGFKQKLGIYYFDTYAPVDMREADVIFGIRIKHESNGIAISQFHYIEKVLKKFNYFDFTSVSTPMDTSKKMMPNNSKVVSQLEYSRVIGCLMYAMTCTRPDIAFDVGKLSRVFLLGGGVISWASKKQTCITGLTMESKFVALAAAGKEAEWLRNLIFENLLWSKPIAPISICCDSAATLAKTYSQMYNGKSRHLGVRHSMIRELITNWVISIEFVRYSNGLKGSILRPP
nr:zinc finger, CCHC-type [Tanacetum cinerariifolium]